MDFHTSALTNGTLTNTVGHAAGVLIFGIFLYLVFRQRSMFGLGTAIGRPAFNAEAQGLPRKSWLPLMAALLALLWNLASLVGLILLGRIGDPIESVIAAFSFSILSLLPAVLLQMCLDGRFPWLVRAGYALSTFAVAAHVVELVASDTRLHRTGLSVITIGFGLLTLMAVAGSLRSSTLQQRPVTSRLLATMSLFLFAISFIHFGDGHLDQAWSQELAFHHAGIPLALFVLMQEYRFILVDAFIRFLANGLLAAVFGWMIVRLTSRGDITVHVFVAALLVALFALSREALQGLLTRVVFRQPNPESVARAIHALRAHYEDEGAYLPDAARRIADLMGAPLVDVVASLPLHNNLLSAVRTGDLPELRDLQRRGVYAVVPIRLSVGDARYVLLGERRGGRPYLSEDFEPLGRMAAVAAEQLERIRAEETGRLVTEAELRALQAQIHPHFLFNALNTLYGIIPREAAPARRTVLNLADIFRYFLRPEKAFVTLEEEMHIVEAYLSIESQRLGDKLIIDSKVDPALLHEQIPVLSIQPLVENAVKHGVAARTRGGTVTIRIDRGETVRTGVTDQGEMRISISDDGPGLGATRLAGPQDGTGLGLKNVSRRLQLCYGAAAEIVVDSTASGTCVSFRLPCGAQYRAQRRASQPVR